MRVSTDLMQRLGVDAMLTQQAKLSRTQMQLASGKRLLTAADDPGASAAALQLRQGMDTVQQYQRNSDAAQARLGMEENTLTGIMDALQRVRELAVQGNNDSQNANTRASMAQEVRGLKQLVLGLANTRDNNNEYLFAGYQTQTQPFAASGGSYTYQGDDGQRLLAIGTGLQVAVGDSGKDAFMAIRNGNGTFATSANGANTGSGIIDAGSVSGTFVRDTYVVRFVQALPTDPVTYEVRDAGGAGALVASGNYVSGDAITFNGATISVTGQPANNDTFTVAPSQNQDIFTTIESLAQGLEKGSTGAALAQLHTAVNRAMSDIDQTAQHLEEFRAQIGARMNMVDQQKGVNDAVILHGKELVSSFEDLDYVEATGRFNLELVGYQAAQQAFAKVQNLSLFNYF